jgi:subtilase family serine protease
MLLFRPARNLAMGCLLLAPTLLLAAQDTLKAPQTDDVAAISVQAQDLGEADSAQATGALTLQFKLVAAQQAALNQLLVDQQNPGSPSYHRWLTPEQFRARFGPTAAQRDAAGRWLSGHGFVVSEASRGGLFVRFSGTVAQAESAFSMSIHRVSRGGGVRLIAATEPKLPAELAGFSGAIGGLEGYRAKSHGRAQSNAPQPALTTSAGIHYLAPSDFYTIYNEQPLLSGNVNGTGVSIAVIGQTDIYAADITAFQTAAGLAKVQPAVSTYGADPGYPSVADLNEAEADLEWANAVAPGATILYINSNDAIQGSLTEAIDNNVAPIITTSYGACEASLGTNTLAYFNLLLQMANAEGITVLASTGDSGATDCDANVGSAVNGLAVDFPASSPQVVAVGGTEFSEGTGVYWSASNSSTGGSATAYIPEVVWNDDNGAGLAASGGGPSAYFSKPAWQSGPGVPNDYSRDLPDISLAASINHDGYLICTGNNCSNGFQNASGGYEVYGGTSLSTPAFAGLLALVEQKVGSRLGNAGPVIYALANSSYASNVFHDVVSGTNASPCTQGTPNCGSSGTIGFAATAGYDEATGWGSVNAYNLANSWSLVTPTASTTGTDPSSTNLAGNLIIAVSGATINFTINVASGTTASTATPTGVVQITIDSVPIGSAIMLSGGAAMYPLNTGSLTAGMHAVQATYTGDGTFSGSKGTFNITITAAGAPDFVLTPATANVTVVSGAIAPPVIFSVNALGGFTGTVNFTASLVAPLAAQSSFTNNPVTINSASNSATTSFSLLAYTYNSRLDAVPGLRGWTRGGTTVLLSCTLLLFLPRRRKLLLLVLTAVIAGSITGCGPNTKPSTTAATTGTPTGTYSVLVQATATVNGSVIEHTATITYVVQ